MLDYLKLVRIQNLGIIIVMHLVFKHFIIDARLIETSLNNWQFGLLILATVCIAAGGYIINNILDVETDLINKPQNVVIHKTISESVAYNLYFALNVTGVGIGYYISNVVNKPSMLLVFIATSSLLYVYSTMLKQILLVGNLIISLLIAFSVLIIPIFLLYPIINVNNQQEFSVLFSIFLDYAVFAFVINLIREIIKDIEDYKGDLQEDLKTLPVVIGISKTAKITAILCVLTAIYIVYYSYHFYFINNLNITTLYTVTFVIAPLLYIGIQLFQANEQTNYKSLSTILKFILFFGILTTIIIQYNISFNA